MKPLFTKKQFETSKVTDKLPCRCYTCNKPFYKTKRDINKVLLGLRVGKFCSSQCKNNKQPIPCTNCSSPVMRPPRELKRAKNTFCSRSCNTTYNNKNKITGNRRSKLEIWIEGQLRLLYPNVQFLFNDKTTIGSELDIYIPSLNIAFELNGIFHYEPIYGIDKLGQIQSNDISKTKACHDAKIDLCIIDTSLQSYVKPSTSKKYLDMIINIIESRQ